MHVCWHHHASPQATRKHWLVAIFIVACVLLLVGTLAPLLQLHVEDVDNRAVAKREETTELNNWTDDFLEDIIDSVRAVRLVDGYVLSSVLKAGDAFVAPNESYVPNPDILADKAFQQTYLQKQREEIAQFPGRNQSAYNSSYVDAHYPLFNFIARQAMEQSSALVAMFLCPQGVIAGAYSPDGNPRVMRLQYFDLLDESKFSAKINPSPMQVKENKTIAFITCSSHVFGSSQDQVGWFLLVLKPLFIADVQANAADSNFWGFTASLLNLTYIVEQEQLAGSMDAASMDYVLYDTSQSGQYLIVSTSLALDTLDKETIGSFIATSSISVKLYLNTTLKLAVQSSKGIARVDGDTCVQVVGAVLGGVLLLFALAAGAVLLCTRTYDGRPHAPKGAPFALLIIGPTRGDHLWEAAPDLMPAVQRGTDAVLQRAMTIYHAYQIPATHPYTSSYVTRTVDAAVHMAMHVLEDLQRRPVDGPLRAKLGGDGRLLLSCAIHWCAGDSDAAHVQPQGKSYVYEGTSVKEGTRLWLYAAPNTVTLSSDAAHPHAAAMRGVAITRQRAVTLASRPEHPIELFTITDPDSKLLAQARAEVHAAHDKTYVEEVRESSSSRPSSNFTSKNESFAASRTDHSNPHHSHLSARAEDSDTPLPLGPAARRRDPHAQPDTPLTNGSNDPPMYDPVAYALQRPDIPVWVERALRNAFEQQAVALDIHFDHVQVIVYYFFASFKLLFRPLAAPERANIFRRLVTAFGVPQQNILDHLAARCTIRYLQQMDEPRYLGTGGVATSSSENHTAPAPTASHPLTTITVNSELPFTSSTTYHYSPPPTVLPVATEAAAWRHGGGGGGGDNGDSPRERDSNPLGEGRSHSTLSNYDAHHVES